MLSISLVIVFSSWLRTISDNAQGIAEMSGEFEGRPAEILRGLDAVGNSTKAITKGMAIATAVIAATSLFGSFEEALRAAGFDFLGIRIDRPDVLVGLLIGGAVGVLFSSLGLPARGRGAPPSPPPPRPSCPARRSRGPGGGPTAARSPRSAS